MDSAFFMDVVVMVLILWAFLLIWYLCEGLISSPRRERDSAFVVYSILIIAANTVFAAITYWF